MQKFERIFAYTISDSEVVSEVCAWLWSYLRPDVSIEEKLADFVNDCIQIKVFLETFALNYTRWNTILVHYNISPLVSTIV